jgi:hypothetical protein
MKIARAPRQTIRSKPEDGAEVVPETSIILNQLKRQAVREESYLLEYNAV